MITDQQWLWIGVVHEIMIGLVFACLFWWFIRVPYSFELGALGAKQGFWESIRWMMALTWGAFSLVHFFQAYWLMKYILTQPIPI
jgi:hypothetical protein